MKKVIVTFSRSYEYDETELQPADGKKELKEIAAQKAMDAFNADLGIISANTDDFSISYAISNVSDMCICGSKTSKECLTKCDQPGIRIRC